MATTYIGIAVAAGALALAAAVPAAAPAATIGWEGDTLIYRAAPGESNRTGPWGGVLDETKVTLSDGYGVPLQSTTERCTQVPGDERFECDVPARMVFELGDGDDHVTFSTGVPDIPYEIHAGEGADHVEGFASQVAHLRQLVEGGPGDDTLTGHLGNDVLRGGPGNDTVDGGAGDDAVDGGDGDDTVFGDHYEAAGSDTIDGGAGTDSLADYVIPGADVHPPAAVSMDDVANDGRPGEQDNVLRVEKLDVGVSGTYTGGPGADDIFVRAGFDEGSSVVSGLGGDDRLKGHDYREAIDGGPGDDTIEGGLNDDVLTGGPGRDLILGDSSADTCNFLACRYPFGNDVVQARDGEKDSIDCGVGEDAATVDAIDVVAGCERVDTGGGGGGGGGAGPAGDGLVVAAKARRAALRRKGLAVKVACAQACKVTAKLTLKGRPLGSGSRTLGAAGTARLTVKLSAAGRKRLRTVRKGSAKLAVKVADATGTRTLTRKLNVS